jgi:hypothetical protein
MFLNMCGLLHDYVICLKIYNSGTNLLINLDIGIEKMDKFSKYLYINKKTKEKHAHFCLFIVETIFALSHGEAGLCRFDF